MDSDEALARRLQAEQDRLDREAYDADLALARQLQQDEWRTHDQPPIANPHADQCQDPNPDLHALFVAFDSLYFAGKLAAVEVQWSTKMTLCAGLCYYKGPGHCLIRLSEPLLKFRSREDMVNTLLHEMVHAYLFLEKGPKFADHDGHGPEFLKEAGRINTKAGTNITVYHNFNDEVDHYRRHVWLCNGPCRDRPPYFGVVKRSMNRPPQPADLWYREHELTCGGKFEKIAEPEKSKKAATPKSRKITEFFDEDRDVGASSSSSSKKRAKTQR